CARQARSARAPVDRRRRRARLGAGEKRQVRRGAGVFASGASPRDARRAEVLPPRDDRALPRPSRRGANVVSTRAPAEPGLLAPLGSDGEEVRAMKRLVLFLLLLGALAVPASAAAHPLGNFTVNRFSRIEVSGHRVYVLYVLDLAEIPTFQAGRIDPALYARRIARGAELTVDDRRVALTPGGTALAHPPGAGGLRATRLEVVLRGPELAGTSSVQYRDTNYSDRIGWKEIVVGKDAPSRSDELRAYPKDMLQSPLDITSADANLKPGSGPETPPALSAGKLLQAPDRIAASGFARLIGRERLGFWVVLASLAAALFWGAAHALSPGHGKTIVTAYLVGQRGTPWHAALLGLVVTVTHTLG